MNKQLGHSNSDQFIERVRQLIPHDDWYKRAQLASVCDNFDLAFDYLEKAAQLERFDSTQTWKDPDFQWIRDDPRFTRIVGSKPE